MTRQLEALDRQFDKYGHDALIRQPSGDIPTKVLGASFKTLYQSGTTIVNPNYRLFLRPVRGSDDITLSTKIVINGAQLNILAFKKITPDVANAIVWEVEATGGVVPKDPSTISAPIILSPLDLAEYVPTTTGSDLPLDAITFIAATPTTTGGATWTSTDWVVIEEVSLALVASATVTGSASTLHSGGRFAVWNAPAVFSKVVNYDVRCRHHGFDSDSVAITTAWSSYNTWSRVQLINPAPPITITKPSIITTVDASGVLELGQVYTGTGGGIVGKYKYPASNLGKVFLKASTYAPITAGNFGSIDWQVSLASDFSSFVINGNQTGDWFDMIEGINYPKEIMWIGQQDGQFPITRNVVHYARVRYNSSDSKTSEWSDTLAFKMVGVDSVTS